MAAITISTQIAAGTTTNATKRKVPRRLSATAFEDSNINDSGNQTSIYKTGNGMGIVTSYNSENVKIGQCLAVGNDTFIQINNLNGTIEAGGAQLVANGSSGSSGLYLNLLVNNVPFVIELQQP